MKDEQQASQYNKNEKRNEAELAELLRKEIVRIQQFASRIEEKLEKASA